MSKLLSTRSSHKYMVGTRKRVVEAEVVVKDLGDEGFRVRLSFKDGFYSEKYNPELAVGANLHTGVEVSCKDGKLTLYVNRRGEIGADEVIDLGEVHWEGPDE